MRVALALGLLLVLAAPARAASVTVTSRCDKVDCIHTARYAAAPGERNALTIAEGPGTVTFHDDGAVVEARAGCVAVDAHTARCEPPPSQEPEPLTGSARLGDRDDVARAAWAVIDGGPGERDVVRGIRSVVGSRGDDVLIGSEARNRLEGGPGADVLRGGGGDDQLLTTGYRARFGRALGEVVQGGPGRDEIDVSAEGPGASRGVDCGPGRDRVSEVLPADRIAPSCERVAIGETIQELRLRAVLPRLRAPFASERRCFCRGRGYAVRRGSRTIATARGREGRVVLRLNALGRRLLAARERLWVTVVALGEGVDSGFSTRISLLRPACGPAGDSIAATRDARVYVRVGRVLGCHRARPRPTPLGRARALLGARAAGRFAAVALRGRPLAVYDLRRGIDTGRSAERIPRLSSLRLTAGGVAAYIARLPTGEYEVGAPALTFEAARGRDIDPRYLRIAGNVLAWREGRAFGVVWLPEGPAAPARVLASNRTVVLEARGFELLARRHGGGRRVPLGNAICDCISSSGNAGVTTVAVAGRFAAARYASSAFREGRSEDRITVADTTEASTRETCVSGGIRSFLVTAEGGVACAVEAEFDTSIRRRTRQIRSEDAVIDEGPGIDLRSLHRRGAEIVWRHDGAERTAPLPRRG